mgnify:FL=1
MRNQVRMHLPDERHQAHDEENELRLPANRVANDARIAWRTERLTSVCESGNIGMNYSERNMDE